MDDRIGSCSECGGPVVVPSMMVNPTAHCLRCGAIPRYPHGPVIPMRPPRPTWTNEPPTRIDDEQLSAQVGEWRRRYLRSTGCPE